jgi:hypothetical protein
MFPVRRAQSLISPRLVGAGAAGIVAVFAVAPFAGAATPSKPASTDAPVDPGPAHDAGTAKQLKPVGAVQTVAPDFGFQKFRVGVQIKTGAFVPDGTTTAGSEVHIVERDGDTVVKEETCTTLAETEVPPSTETYCRFEEAPSVRRAATAQGFAPAVAVDLGSADYYTAPPGNTVTLTQTKVMPNLLIDPVSQTRDPVDCDAAPLCFTDAVTFTDPGLPPVATDDSATTDIGKPIDIAVLGNDDSKQAPTIVEVTKQPRNGTARVVNNEAPGFRSHAANGTQTTRYTPKAGFFGHDVFTYKITTANGTATAKVFITIKPPPPTAVNDSATTPTNTAVTIAVLSNDDSNGVNPLHLKAVGDPSHGTTELDGRKVIYTPSNGFTGVDTFRYLITTRGGSDNATVTVTVTAPPTPTPTRNDDPLAVTGVPTATLGELGIGLLLIGGAATAVGRRRRGGSHS